MMKSRLHACECIAYEHRPCCHKFVASKSEKKVNGFASDIVRPGLGRMATEPAVKPLRGNSSEAGMTEDEFILLLAQTMDAHATGFQQLASLQQELDTMRNEVDTLRDRAGRLEALMKPITDQLGYVGTAVVSTIFVGSMTVFAFSKTSKRYVVLHPAIAATCITTVLLATFLIVRWVARGQLTHDQYIHLARAAVLAIVTTYAGAYAGPDAATAALVVVFFGSYVLSLWSARTARVEEAKQAAACVVHAV